MQHAPTAAFGPDRVRDFRNISGSRGPDSIRIDRYALRDLEFQTRGALNAIRGHGVETGGLILGMLPGDAAQPVVIAGFYPVEIEHRFGPAFRLSDGDLETFSEAAEEAVEDGEQQVIGYYRSHLRGAAEVRDEDRRLISHLFPSGESCLGLVAADAQTPSEMELFAVRPGVSPVRLAVFPVKEIRGQVAKPVPAPPVEAREEAPEASEPATTPAQGNGQLFWAFAGGMAAVGILVLALGMRSGRSSEPVAPVVTPTVEQAGVNRIDATLGLRVTRRGGQYEVRWDTAVPVVRSGVRGRIIVPEESEPIRELDVAQVRAGVYRHTSDRSALTFVLVVFQADGRFADETTSVTRSSTAATVASAVPPQPAGAGERLPSMMFVDGKQVAPAAAAREEVLAPEPEPVSNATNAPAPAPVHAEPEPASVPVQQVPPPAPVVTAPVQTPVQTVAPPPPRPSYSVAPPPAEKLLAPRILRPATPAIPLGVAPAVLADVQLDVMVTIDNAGRVTDARVISAHGAAAGQLTIPALKAARQYRFLPATLEGKPVAGSMLLTFRFSRQPK